MAVHYVVIGGGIAGVSCVESISFDDKDAKVTLISASPLIKTITNYVQLTRVAETFEVEEKPLSFAKELSSNVSVLQAAVESLNCKEKSVTTSGGQVILYDKLCICTGGKPKVIAEDNPYVIGIRDTESVKDFQTKVKSARRMVIVGNGGIATELVFELEGCEVIWAIKDKSIAHTFVDGAAGAFLVEQLNTDKAQAPHSPVKRHKYTTEDVKDVQTQCESKVMGGALGPDWMTSLDMHGPQSISHRVHVEHQVEVRNVIQSDRVPEQDIQNRLSALPEGWADDKGWPAFVELSNGKVYGCDLVVSATGVVPSTDMVVKGNHLELAADGGLQVKEQMQTSEQHVFAAGDVCTACWQHSPQWTQMRLWSQARQMGCYAAKCMIASHNGEEITMDFCFELFAHVTSFFNFKVVLLGKFNAQGLDNKHEILLRVTKGKEYVKAILLDGRLVGAILIGDTDLEETFENLILNSIDLTPFKDHFLDPDIDIEDFFD